MDQVTPRHLSKASRPVVAIVFPGMTSTDAPSARLGPMVEALGDVGLLVQPVVYNDDWADGLTRRLLGVAAVLAWVDPIGEEGDRRRLDGVLREISAAGVWVGSHPDVIDRLGTKEVLVTTRDMGWGSDAHLYRTSDEFRRGFPERLAADGVRVLKASRGNGGRTVWKIRLTEGATSEAGLPPGAAVRVQHARVRDASMATMPLADLIASVDSIFGTWAGTCGLVDQEFIPGVTRGILRCYLVGGEVVGFARQYPLGARPVGLFDIVTAGGGGPDQVFGLPSPKTMHPAEEPALADLRHRLETDWVPEMISRVGVAPERLPVLWDVDLLLADPAEGQGSGIRPVLCEINASSVIPFPRAAPRRVAAHVVEALHRHRDVVR